MRPPTACTQPGVGGHGTARHGRRRASPTGPQPGDRRHPELGRAARKAGRHTEARHQRDHVDAQPVGPGRGQPRGTFSQTPPPRRISAQKDPLAGTGDRRTRHRRPQRQRRAAPHDTRERPKKTAGQRGHGDERQADRRPPRAVGHQKRLEPQQQRHRRGQPHHERQQADGRRRRRKEGRHDKARADGPVAGCAHRHAQQVHPVGSQGAGRHATNPRAGHQQRVRQQHRRLVESQRRHEGRVQSAPVRRRAVQRVARAQQDGRQQAAAPPRRRCPGLLSHAVPPLDPRRDSIGCAGVSAKVFTPTPASAAVRRPTCKNLSFSPQAHLECNPPTWGMGVPDGLGGRQRPWQVPMIRGGRRRF